ncbi:MAG: hypothetical protein WC886_07485, partial [Saccharofermentanaceae bacterium]
MTNDQILLQKLDRFIKKYYRNRLIRGALFLFALLGCFYLAIILLEFLFRFNQTVRAVFLFSYLSLALGVFIRFIAIPLFQLLKIGRIISYEQAAEIIGKHFSEIQDKLLNTLQLIHQKKVAIEPTSLLEASIDQKISGLKLFQFTAAIDFRKNLKYLKYVIIPLFFFLLIAILSPGTISEPTQRIVRFNQAFEPKLPFRIEILNKKLTAMQQENFELKIKITGEEIPSEFFIQSGDVTFKMQRNKEFIFTYIFRSVQSDITFKLSAGTFLSDKFTLKVFPKPIILNFNVKIDYPAYIHKPAETVENTGDLMVPEGSILTWNIFTKDVDNIQFKVNTVATNLKKLENNSFTYSKKVLTTTSYSIFPWNKYCLNNDSLSFKITVINDGFPSIVVTEATDPALNTSLFFKGTVKDDYGFTKLTFNYTVASGSDTAKSIFKEVNIPLADNLTNQNFYYNADLTSFVETTGETINYYFEIWDNDGVNGPKSTRTEIKKITTPTLKEIEKNTNKNVQNIEKDMESGLKESGNMKNTINDLNRRMTEKPTMSWQEKKKVEGLLKSQERILENIDDIKNRNLENIQNEEKFMNTSERIVEKQRQLNSLMEQLLTEEMKKLMEEMKNLLEQVDKNKLADLMEKIKLSNEDLENQLDRNLELFKQIEFERNLENLVNDLKKNAIEQDRLAERAEKDKGKDQQIVKDQKTVKSTSDSISQNLKDLQKEKQGLESNPDLSNAEKKQDSITKDLNEIEKQVNGKEMNKASENMKEAAKKMEELASELENSLAENEDEQMEEDAQNIRQILENLIRLSFEQEDLILKTRITARNDPKYITLVENQKEMGDKISIIEDSLNAIARRQIMLQPIISRETSSIEKNIQACLSSMNNRQTSSALSQQQLTMTAMNNLALLLNESLEKMNQQMSMSMMGKGKKSSCQKTSNPKGKGSMKNMKSMQQKLGEQLEKIKDGIEKMKNSGKGNKNGNSELNKQIAKLAAQQEAIRNEMQKYKDELSEQGIKDGGSLKETIKTMEQNETDIINKRITQETMNRQQSILTRMLESEKAEQEREKEEKRESTEAKNQKYSNPFFDFKYKSKERSDQETLQLVTPSLSNFYRAKVNTYIL